MEVLKRNISGVSFEVRKAVKFKIILGEKNEKG